MCNISTTYLKIFRDLLFRLSGTEASFLLFHVAWFVGHYSSTSLALHRARSPPTKARERSVYSTWCRSRSMARWLFRVIHYGVAGLKPPRDFLSAPRRRDGLPSFPPSESGVIRNAGISDLLLCKVWRNCGGGVPISVTLLFPATTLLACLLNEIELSRSRKHLPVDA